MTQICTRIEQSKKLEGLGISTDTSDMSIWRQTKDWKGRPIERKMRIDATPFNQLSHIVMGVESFEEYPAWSLGALIKLLPDTIILDNGDVCGLSVLNIGVYYRGFVDRNIVQGFENENIFDNCVNMIEWAVRNEHIKNKK